MYPFVPIEDFPGWACIKFLEGGGEVLVKVQPELEMLKSFSCINCMFGVAMSNQLNIEGPSRISQLRIFWIH